METSFKELASFIDLLLLKGREQTHLSGKKPFPGLRIPC